MLDSLQPILVITRREVRDQLRDWRIVLPLVILTLFFPILMQFTAGQIVDFVRNEGGEDILFERLFPFLLMIVGFFPITVSLVIALESFAGETERRSIEPLLDSPLADWQLYFGKLLAGIAASVAASYLGVMMYVLALYFTVGWSPPPELFILVLLLTLVEAVVMVSGSVVVSTQTTSVRAANLLASFIIIPMALLLQVESVIMFWGDYDSLWLVLAGQVVLVILLVRTGLAYFNREDLLGRELDSINLRATWRTFKGAFMGKAVSFRQWYQHEISLAVRKLFLPTVLQIPLMIAGFVVGLRFAENLPANPDLAATMQRLMDGGAMQDLIDSGFVSWLAVLLLWLNNLKSVVIVSLLGSVSFGVVGVLGLLVTPAALGVITGLAVEAGISPWLLATAYFLPHGILEVPAILISAAAILRLGATLVTPAKDKSIGKAWLIALADWLKVFLAVVLPLFLLAALVEVFITPRWALMLIAP